VILTVHNRKDQTLMCLDSVFNQENNREKFDVKVYLTDDGSTDGTAEAVRERYPDVNILTGSGDLYWNRGMHLAFGESLKKDYDYYLWLNNDTIIFKDALIRLLRTSNNYNDKAIIVGSTKDPETNKWTYGGAIINNKFRPLKFTPVFPGKQPKLIDTMNGNCVLIPEALAKELGNLDPAFTHGMGDRDYGLRARKKGIQVYIAPGYFGYCKRNPPIEYPKSIKKYFKLRLSKKDLPLKEFEIFARRHAGPFWPLYAISPYIRGFLNLVFKQKTLE